VTDATLYTAPSNTKAKIRSIIVANTAGSAATFSLALNGTAATAANCLFSAQSVPANTTAIFYPEGVMAAADTIHALASATSVTFTVMGEELAFAS
jgi:hypothetical protein